MNACRVSIPGDYNCRHLSPTFIYDDSHNLFLIPLSIITPLVMNPTSSQKILYQIVTVSLVSVLTLERVMVTSSFDHSDRGFPFFSILGC